MGLFKTPEELRKMGWMPQDEASKLLGLPQGEMISWDYIDSEQTASDGKNWVLLLPGVGGRPPTTDDRRPDSDAGEKTKNEKRKRRQNVPADPAVMPKYERIPSKRGRWGEREILISMEEAAARLGWSVAWTKKQVNRGYIEGRWVEGMRMVVLQAVEWWIRAHAEQSERRRAERERKRNLKVLESGVQQTSADADDTERGDDRLADVWVSMPEAAKVLGVATAYVYQLVKRGKLESRTPAPRKMQVRLAQLLDRIAAREEKQSRKSISVKEWKYDLRHPYIRTRIEAPSGDELISRKEAAFILGCGPNSVSELVLRGTLFGWQKVPGRQSSRLWLSRRQVERYAQDPLRIKAQAARKRRGIGPKVHHGWDAQGIEAYQYLDSSSFMERDHGEYYTARQVARLLGVSCQAVVGYRRSGRLKGFRRPCRKGTYERRRWWFFDKEEVHALMNDPQYIKNRDKYRRSQTPEARAEKQIKELRAFYAGKTSDSADPKLESPSSQCHWLDPSDPDRFQPLEFLNARPDVW